MAHETQYWSFKYILGTEYSEKTEASEISPAGDVRINEGFHKCKVILRMAADSTMLRMVNLLIALSLGVHREQLEQRMGLTWPRPFLLRPLKRLSVLNNASISIVIILGCALLDHFDGIEIGVAAWLVAT